MTHWTDRLVELQACKEAVEWARTQPDFATAWATCQRGDWMEWLLGELKCWPDGAEDEHERVFLDRSSSTRVRAEARAEYWRVRAEALAEYDRVGAEARAEYWRVTSEALAKYDRVMDEARAEYERATAEALRHLGPVVALDLGSQLAKECALRGEGE